MLRATILQIMTVAFSLAAADVSFNLLAKHIGGAPGPAWFEMGCGTDDDGRGADCAAVLASPWSYWPPKLEGDPPDRPRLPVAFLGLVYYSVLAIWFFGVGCPSRAKRWVLLLPLFLTALGLIGSLFFTYIMFTRLDEWCSWCLVTHLLNLAIAICLVLMWPRKAAVPTATTPDGASGTKLSGRHSRPSGSTDPVGSGQSTHPSWRLTAVTVLAMGLVAFGQNEMLGRAQSTRQILRAQGSFTRCMGLIEQFRQSGDKLMADWSSGKRHELPLRSSDLLRRSSSSKGTPLQVVVFSDFECPSCRKLARFLEEKAQPMFEGNLAVLFKHYPLSGACNPHVSSGKHQHACAAARLAEAARFMGDNDTFWKAHDYLFENQDRLKLGKIKPAEMAQNLGFDLDAFLSAMNAGAVSTRLRQDIDLGGRIGLKSTPAVFVDSKRVGVFYTMELNFWDKLADLYWDSRDEPRPEATRLPKSGSIRDSQGRSAAP